MSGREEIEQATEELVRKIHQLTECMLDGGSDDERIKLDWGVLRYLDHYRSVAFWKLEDGHDVLGWVPPVSEIEDENPENRGLNKVVQFANWVFAVADEDRAVSRGAARISEDPSSAPPRTSRDVVSHLFEEEMDWPGSGDLDEMGLRLELVSYSTHTLHPVEGSEEPC